MGYYLYDGNGYVGDLASNQGMNDLAAFIDQYAGEWLQHFIVEGWVPISADLIADAAALPVPDDPAVQETVNNLKEMLGRCVDVAIISDGAE
jgi:hypothetical protein